MNLKTFLKLTRAAVLGLAAGCAVGPDHEAPRPALPASWKALEEPAAGRTSRATAGGGDLSLWWRAFGDPALTSLVERALAANLDLRGAAARVREARALHGVALGQLLPEAGAAAGYQRFRLSENGAVPTDGAAGGQYLAGFDASWEIDLFGGNRRSLEAVAADVEASVEALRDVQVTLLAELARTYAGYRGLQARKALARQSLAAQQRTAALTRARFDAGQTTELDVTRAEGLVATTAAQLPALEAAERRTAHAIDLLLARSPGDSDPELSSPAPIPSAPAELPVGAPTDLLRRRPDLRRAERDLAAATARIGAATADLYPRFFLTGAFGLESLEASDFLTASSRAWSAGPRIQWPLFQGGRIRANIEVRNARQEQAALRFEQTLLGALRDVEDALVAHSREQVRHQALVQGVSSQRRAVELAEQRYLQGLVDFQAVLEAQRSFYAAQDDLVQSDQAMASHAIALYKAVGGGWRPE